MVFSATSLGPFLYLHFYLLFFIPRVAGSLRTVRSLASVPKSKPPHSGPDFLSASSTGLFLGSEIPRNTSLIKVYGRKSTGASVNAPLSASEQVLTCLFSLALDRHTDHLLELHNIYDDRFGTYGEISFSFVEYIIDDDGNSPTPAAPMQICEHHLHWPPHDNALLRRDDTSTSAPPSTTSTSCPPGHLSNQMNIMIGLIAALVTLILLIFIVVALYVLFRHRLFRLKQDPEGEGGKLEVLSRSSLRNKSTTLFSTTDTANPEAHSKYIADPLPKDRYIPDPQETYLSDPTSSFSTHVDLAQMDNWHRPPQTNTSPLATRRIPPRPRVNPPPSDPPKEPVPEIPKIPQSSLIRPPSGFSLPTVSSHGQTRSQRPLHRADEIPVQGVGRFDSNTGSNTPESSIQTHIRNQSSSDISSTSHEGRFNARPPSKALPPMPVSSPAPSGLLFKSTPVQKYVHLTQSSQEQIEVPRYIECIDGQARMQTIPESNRSSGLENASPSATVPTAATQENIGSSVNGRKGALAQPRTPQEFLSISHPKRPELVFSQGRELGHTYPPEPLQRGVRESAVRHLSQARLSIKIPADPEDWFTPPATTSLPSSTEGKPLAGVKKPSSQGQSSDWKVQPLRYTALAKNPPSRRAGSHPLKGQQVTYAAAREMGLSPKVTVIAPLSPHKRALPKIPM